MSRRWRSKLDARRRAGAARVKTFRTPGPMDPERLDLVALWELGCRGMAASEGDVLAYFDAVCDLPIEGVWEDVPEVDYVAAYTAGLRPVRAGSLVIAPSHAQVTLEDGDQVIWLDPGSAFGTGHHETTHLALESLSEADLVGRAVLDVGAGSGVLAIAADRLGAALALGVDTDPSTLRVARDNARRNRSRARFLVGSLEHPELPRMFDAIVANLYAEIHAALLPAYAERLVPGGRLWLTGILASRRDLVRAAVPSALRLDRVRAEGEWVLMDLERVR